MLSFANPGNKGFSKAHAVDGYAAAVAAKRKVTQYNKHFNIPPGQFAPFAAEVTGRLHPTARATISKFVAGLLPPGPPEERTPADKIFYSTSVQFLLTSIQVAIAKATSGTLRRIAVGVPANVATGGDDADSDGDSESDDASSVAPGDLNGGCEDSDDDA